jgi:sterol desaturase/sphingolipid hydroxylase (fatty acid hydroxylase superfamily)
VTRLERFHDAHHARQNVNFGITTTMWDRLFGTFQPMDDKRT